MNGTPEQVFEQIELGADISSLLLPITPEDTGDLIQLSMLAYKSQRFEVVEQILDMVGNGMQGWEIIFNDNFLLFLPNDHPQILERINIMLDIADPEQKQVMIAAKDFYAFRFAASSGSLEMVNRLLEIVDSAQKQAMIAAYDFYAFRSAAIDGNLEIVNRLLEVVDPEQKQAMIAARDFDAFHFSALKGNLEMVSKLLEAANSAQKQAMIAAYDFYVFHSAVRNRNFEMVSKLLEVADAEQKQQMIAFLEITNPKLLALINFPPPEPIIDNPNYQDSPQAFATQIMTEVYRNAMLGAGRAALEDWQINLATNIAIRVGGYILENLNQIRSAREKCEVILQKDGGSTQQYSFKEGKEDIPATIENMPLELLEQILSSGGDGEALLPFQQIKSANHPKEHEDFIRTINSAAMEVLNAGIIKKMGC